MISTNLYNLISLYSLQLINLVWAGLRCELEMSLIFKTEKVACPQSKNGLHTNTCTESQLSQLRKFVATIPRIFKTKFMRTDVGVLVIWSSAFWRHTGSASSLLDSLCARFTVKQPDATARAWLNSIQFYRSKHWSSVQTGIMAQWLQYTILLTAVLPVWSSTEASRRQEFTEAQVTKTWFKCMFV